MAKKFDSYFIDSVTIGDQELAQVVVGLKYYESILSPSISLEIILVDSSGQIYNQIKVGDRAAIRIRSSEGSLEFDGDNALYVRRISGSSPGSTKDVMTLTLTSYQSLVNETSRVVEKYSGKISNIVNKILTEKLKTRNIFIEDTANNYSFIGNARKPFHVLTWLCKKSIPQNSFSGKDGIDGSAGYFFYQDANGYKFVSVDTICSGNNPSNLSETPKYIQSEVSQPDSDTNRRRILNVVFKKNNDLIENLKVGMYSNISYFYNIYDQTTKCYQYNLEDNYGTKVATLSQDSVYNAPEGVKDSPSRIMLSVLDQGTLDPTSGISNEFPQDQTKYQSQAVSRYNLIFSQTVSITVYCNTNLRVGDVIDCEFISGPDGKDTVRSGKYIISELAHQFSDNSAYTGIELIRDSYESA